MAADMRYFVGLDLGQAQDFTALAVLERFLRPHPSNPGEQLRHFAVRYVQRLPLGTPYTDVCSRVTRLFEHAQLRGSTLVVDHTGVGRPVLDLLRRSGVAAKLCPMTITGGSQARRDDTGGWYVPKKDIVGVLQVLLQERRFRVARQMPEAATLVQELSNFRVKVTAAANETFEAWRTGQHDDLVLAVAIAARIGERPTPRLEIWV